KALLCHTVKIRRLKLVDVSYEKTIRKIAVDVQVQPPAVRIHKSCQPTQQGGQCQCPRAPAGADLFQKIFEAVLAAPWRQLKRLPHCTDPIDAEKNEAHQKSAVQIHPQQH